MQLGFRISRLIILSLFPLWCSPQDGLVIPEGLTYKSASKEINERAKATLLGLFSAPRTVGKPRETFGERTVLCGPLLRRELKSLPEMKAITKGQWIIRVPISTREGVRKETLLQGKFFQGPQEISAFWKAIVKTISPKEKFKIRRPNEQELASYWSIIPFDIEEPVFVAESRRHAFLIDFFDDPIRIFLIEDYQILGR